MPDVLTNVSATCATRNDVSRQQPQVQYAQDLAANVPPASLAAIKWQVSKHAATTNEEAMRDSMKLMYASLTTDEFKEGVDSFVEKRDPSWPELSPQNAIKKALAKL